MQTRLHFVTTVSYEIYLPPNLGLRADGGLCTPLMEWDYRMIPDCSVQGEPSARRPGSNKLEVIWNVVYQLNPFCLTTAQA